MPNFSFRVLYAYVTKCTTYLEIDHHWWCAKNATSRRTQQPARLLVGSFQLAADSQLSTHSPSTLDLGSLSTLETRDPATACVDSEASSSTVTLGKAFSMVATTRFIVCDPRASSSLILRSGTRDPHQNQSPSSIYPSPEPGPPPAVVPTSESDWLTG